MNETQRENMRKEVLKMFNAYSRDETERLEERVLNLEKAIAHITVFIADHFKLSDEEINSGNGLLDF